MVSSSRQAIACILLLFGTTLYSQAQTTGTKITTASISGKVTVKGKGVPGVVVVAVDDNFRGGWNRARYRAVTDQSGNYRISNLPEGTYRVTPHAPAFALENEQATNPLIVGEGETVEDVNFVLVRGGVITGKITDSDGQPLTDENVTVTPLDNQTLNMRLHIGGIQTDDRGIYRAFGLQQGKYKVSAGQADYRLPGPSRQSYRQTFYPATTDETKATVIEVSEGSEISNIDIVLANRAPAGFKVSGRIIDGENGKPLPNVVYGIIKKYEGGSSSTSGPRSNADGEFKFENVSPGKYAVYIEPIWDSEMRANPVSFEVTDHDLTGLTIKTVKGASLSGIVVLEGADERPLTTKPDELYIQAWIETSDQSDHSIAITPSVKPDGTFKISGLRGGTAHLTLGSMKRRDYSDLRVIRIERDGIAQPNNAINLEDGEQVAGLRVVVKQFTGTIRGRVKIEDGELPPDGRMVLSVTLLDENPSTRSYRSAELDSRGRFSVDALAAGRYEVQVSIYLPNMNRRPSVSKQEVDVADNAVSEVVLTVKLKTDPDDDDDP